MPALIVVGAQWGDEGKGKVVHYLGAKADVIVRYQGGHNAGHTLILNGKPFALHLVPSGIALPGKRNVIGHGVVVSPQALRDEVKFLEGKGFKVKGRLLVSLGAHVILSYHRHRDVLRESGMRMIGTTQRGIGPCYEDKVARVGIRVADYLDEKIFRRLLDQNLEAKAYELRPVGPVSKIRREILAEHRAISSWMRPYCADTTVFLDRELKKGRKLLLEGAQGAMLDLDLGTYPFVTSSTPTAGGACVGTGIGPTAIDHVLGVSKAYTTRVGLGPFPTEIEGRVADFLREKGREYGATTGRPRRIGWLDLVQLRSAVRTNGMGSLALTKLDTLCHVHPVKVCTAYRWRGRLLREFPMERNAQLEAEPVYESFPGLSDDLDRVRKPSELPRPAWDYIRFIEAEAGAPVSLLSLGPSRERTLVLDKRFRWAA